MKLRYGIAAVLAMTAGAAATPLRLDYCVVDLGGGQFEYTFKLVLDNNDQSWVAGQGFGWIIFGDAAGTASPINDFAADPSSFPVGPFTQVQGSGGGHNGPTLGPVVVQSPPYPANLWIPNAVGEFLTWRGTSATNLPQGQMLWSNLMSGGGSVPAGFVAATLVTCGSSGCYANCDGSTIPPILNVNDFVCFNNRFNAGDSYANCDQSTIPPILNVNDYVCFNTKYAVGCSR